MAGDGGARAGKPGRVATNEAEVDSVCNNAALLLVMAVYMYFAVISDAVFPVRIL